MTARKGGTFKSDARFGGPKQWRASLRRGPWRPTSRRETRKGTRSGSRAAGDDPPACPREPCAFRDRIEAFRSAGALVFGVSTQDEASHREFRDKYALNFPLLADPTKELSRRYNALGLLGVAKRVTYVIGPEGTIRAAFQKVEDR